MKKILFFALMLMQCQCLLAEERQPFSEWLRDLKLEAKNSHISQQTIDKTFKTARFIPKVVELDRAQPEFISPFLSYVEVRVSPKIVTTGREMLLAHNDLLARIEAQYGVPSQVLVAFWGMETHYGKNQGDFALPSALMTLAYEGRRAEFFRSQLLSAMHVVDAGNSSVSELRGSWAGAMGHMQFMPSTLLQYGVDGHGDGRVTVIKALPDAFATAANYLSSIGWRKDEPIAIEVRLPADFDYAQANLLIRKNSSDWVQAGVTQIDGSALPVFENTAVILPQGWQGPAFLITSNFDVVMEWNRSVNYALSVSHLANQLLADQPIIGGAEAEKSALTYNQMWALQAKLNELGFDCGAPDGFPGVNTQSAVREYQASQNLPQDGYAGPSLYQRLFQQ